MSFRIIIAGVIHCDDFDHICFIADHLSQNLPSFLYERLEKSVLEWKGWLSKTNTNYKWHHYTSPLIWKQFTCPNSKPYYIGGASEFLEYCHSYYSIDTFVNLKKLEELGANYLQFRRNLAQTEDLTNAVNKELESICDIKDKYIVCISGSGHPLAKLLIKSLTDIKLTPTICVERKETINKSISKIYLYDDLFSNPLQDDCNEYACGDCSTKIKQVYPLGLALTKSDLLIILDHEPFQPQNSIGEWLEANKKIMIKIAQKINASGPADLRILLPNLGPSCYNATFLTKLLKGTDKRNVVVATSDKGLEIIPPLSEITKISSTNIYCPPVWGFVGINHLVDVKTCIHRYDAFYPYERYQKVKNSTLKIGYKTPEMRTFEYLMHDDETLWGKVLEQKNEEVELLNKSIAVVNLVKQWLSCPGENDIVNLGVLCNGSFGLKFDGVFSQPSRFEEGFWKPAHDFPMPKDSQVKISYLAYMAEHILQLENGALPRIIPRCPSYSIRELKPVNITKKHDIRFAD